MQTEPRSFTNAVPSRIIVAIAASCCCVGCILPEVAGSAPLTRMSQRHPLKIAGSRPFRTRS